MQLSDSKENSIIRILISFVVEFFWPPEISKQNCKMHNISKNTLVACIHRNGKIIIPRGSDMMMPDDTVIIVTTAKGVNDITDILD